jgi:hypothetical protein
MIQPHTYHWASLVCCAIVATIEGIVDVVDPPSLERRFYEFVRISNRVVGVGTIVLSVLLFLRESWAFLGLTLCLAFSMAVALLTLRPEHHSAVKQRLISKAGMIWVFGLTLVTAYVIPIGLLTWLRPIFTAN